MCIVVESQANPNPGPMKRRGSTPEEEICLEILGEDVCLAPVGEPRTRRHFVLAVESPRTKPTIAKVCMHPRNENAQTSFVHRLRLINENNMLKQLHHPHITKLKGLSETKDATILETYKAGNTDLCETLMKKRRFSEPRARNLFQQVLSAVAYMHSEGFIHRDIKGDNLIIGDDDYVTLVDFEFASTYSSKRLITKSVGSFLYASPEILQCKPYHGPEIDMWSLGVTLYTMVTGKFPFAGETKGKYTSNAIAGDVIIPPYMSNELADLLLGLMAVNPAARLTAQEALNHPWVQSSEVSWV